MIPWPNRPYDWVLTAVIVHPYH
nr:hypothetical protein XAC3610_7670029 [Xanthomonas citri pv. citri]